MSPSQSVFIFISQTHLEDVNGQTVIQQVFWVIIIVIVSSLEFHYGLLQPMLGCSLIYISHMKQLMFTEMLVNILEETEIQPEGL